jgi:carbonic anhydrase
MINQTQKNIKAQFQPKLILNKGEKERNGERNNDRTEKEKELKKECGRNVRREMHNLNITNALPIEFSIGITLILIKCKYKATKLI